MGHEPIRILHVFARMDMGGAETFIMNVYRNIDREKIQFDFVVHTNDKCVYDDEILSLGGKIYRVPKYLGKNHMQYKKSWENFLKSHLKYKIIHGHVRSTAYIYLSIAKKFNLITIIHSHNTSSGKGIKSKIKDLFQYPIRYIADYFFACSNNAGKWLFGKKICNSNEFYIIKNAIDIEKFKFNNNIRNKIRNEFKIQDKQFVIGHVGRFHEQKNHIFLIDIFSCLLKERPDAILLLVGDGELRSTIENKVEKLGIAQSVIFTGVRPDVHKLFQAMDIFVFPSLYEGLGIVLIEAQASGLPCVVSNTIPEEAVLSENLKKISLNDKNNWMNELLKDKSEYISEEIDVLIMKSGYAIDNATKWISEFYLEKGKDEISICNR